MNTRFPQFRGCLACALLATAVSAQSQTTPASQPTEENAPVTLPAFEIKEAPANPYISKQALSGTRVAMDVMDIPQSVAVVTNEFIRDSMSLRMLDAAKYITPVTESSLPTGSDRYNMRGFQTSHEFVDGMEISGADGYSMSLATYNIERIEVIKGPNAILVPGGAPGGQFNPITKSPIMKNQSSVTLQLSQYVGNDVSLDVNRVLSKDAAARAVLAYWNTGGYSDRYFREGWMFAPSVSWQLSPAHKLVVKAEVMRNEETNGVFLPLDPANGGASYASVARGLPNDWSFGNRNDYRHRETERLSAELLSTLSNHITSRLMVTVNHVVRKDQGGTNATITGTGGGSINPLTGLYEPGINWNTAAYNADTTGTVVLTGTSAPITAPTTWTFTRPNGADHLFYNEAHFRNDYAAKFEGQGWKSTTIAGLAANASKVRWKTWANLSRTAVANTPAGLAAMTLEDRVYAGAPTVNNKTAKQTDVQAYVFENFSFLGDKLQLSGGLSRFHGTLTRTDTSGVGAIVQPSFSVSTTARSYGVVLKPIPQTSFFYSHNTSGETLPGSLSAGNFGPTFRPQNGVQDEFGVKTSWLENRLTASFAYFDISQTNQQVPNSDWYLDNTKPKDLFLDITSKGWEIEGTYAVNSNLTLIGNISKYKARQALGTRLRGVPDTTWGFYADYRFKEGPLTGFGLNIGVDYRSDAVGQNATGYTTTRALPNGKFVPVQANAIYDGRTIVNAGVTYHAKNWTARVLVANAADEDYVAAVLNRSSLMMGEPRSVRCSFTYDF